MKKMYKICLVMMMALIMCAATACDFDDDRPVKNPTDDPAKDIGEKAVIQIVLDKVPGSTKNDIMALEKEYDDGYLQYEGSLFYEGMEYEFEIDAETGNINNWEIDD